MKKIISLNLDEDLIHEIDKQRGQIPRSPYINTALIEWLRERSVV